jgi:DNA mismatch repair protein MutL
MNRIRLLSEQVANQIAAGEVVERPASVVKELVENALDAQAGRITVEIQAGGRSLIRITDDGIGMSRDDALLCFERHATSKIQRAEDLQAVLTMGFRGEALPSVASVSRLTLTTRERESDQTEATQIVINGGKLLEVKVASSPPGTAVEVRSLFYNLPARRKFLRSEETERAHIHHYLTLAALSHPHVGFHFIHDQRTVWQFPPVQVGDDPSSKSAALKERLRTVYGAELNLLAVDFRTGLRVDDDPGSESSDASGEAMVPDQQRLRLWGFIGAPGVSRSTREDQHLFVNRRPVENRGLNYALIEGYHTALMKGRYPVCCLFLELDPALVDVNIHPAKREVKFRAEREVRNQVSRAVRESLLQYHQGSGAAPRTLPAAEPAVSLPPTHVDADLPGFPSEVRAHPPIQQPEPPSVDLEAGKGQPCAPGMTLPEVPPTPTASPGEPSGSKPTPAVLDQASKPGDLGSRAAAANSQPAPLLSVPLRIVGVVGRLYVVMESDRGLVLLDQHAAHERVLFEQMLERLQQGNCPSQRLLLPQTVELSARDAQFLRENLPILVRLGVGLSEFGERTFLLDGLPPFVRAEDSRQFVLELVDALKSAGSEVNALRLGEHVVAKTVCRHAVKANDPLSAQELEELLASLRRCAMPYTCPHGRPTLLEMNYRELEKRFGRSQ